MIIIITDGTSTAIEAVHNRSRYCNEALRIVLQRIQFPFDEVWKPSYFFQMLQWKPALYPIFASVLAHPFEIAALFAWRL